MKRLFLVTIIFLSSLFTLQAQDSSEGIEYKVITTVESIVPAGVGRSRIIENKESVNVNEYTTERTNGKKSNQGDIKRSDAKIENFAETKLLNFYSLTGINFQNIASNDALISSKLNQLAQEGWELMYVTSGVESDSGETDGSGIFITRFIFKRNK